MNAPTMSLETGIAGQAQPTTLWGRAIKYIKDEATFFRIHLAAFTFIPLIFSGIFHASNGRYHISYLDSLFLCYSAMTVTGLSTVNLSTLTTWQQVILYFLMSIYSRRFFRTHCEYIVAKRSRHFGKKLLRSKTFFMKNISSPIAFAKQGEPAPRQPKDTEKTGFTTPQVQVVNPTPGVTRVNSAVQLKDDEYILSDAPNFTTSPTSATRVLTSSPRSANLVLSPDSEPAATTRSPVVDFAQSTTMSPRIAHYHPMMTELNGRPVPKRGATMLSSSKIPDVPGSTGANRKYQGFGGFPGPAHLAHEVLKLTAPHATRTLQRKMTMPMITTLEADKTPWAQQILNGLVVGRNSDFHTDSLTDEQLEEIGGAEYRALRLLSYLVPAYFVINQLCAVLLFLPWLTVVKTYDGVFESQFRLVSKSWFAFFQVMGAYTGGGLSLVDLGMVPFQNAYLMIIAMSIVILAGNHALPIFLRFVIWVLSKIVPPESHSEAALSFLLDHPRRCFLYLFPSHQTWFLVICLVSFSAIEWVAFLVLNIGIPAYESIPTGPRIIAGLFQGLAARASGFAIVPLASFAPALQFLYVVMMYIAVYPVALSIRSTNVYEERSLGVFEAPPDDEDEEPDDINKLGTRRERVGRSELANTVPLQDIWWLVWAVFIVAIIERGNLLDESKKWFDLFRVVFELVSAFGGIGLSLGFPSNNFSFVGAMSPLSKLVVIVIMVRGRHRGLPVAVDRAVLLPNELVPNKDGPKSPSPLQPTAPLSVF
ncbi:hypothetical protein NLJ89_g3746 [Agrocybe chaxingu]|uniref:Uncharacterized protein n=1 Tax=Agrocybe chaxingu TaxID=84603 RepID=A0A9W8K9J5_9AGAR|nr:hypothetical protein NLJ89_g3746 [Agrocybe chaxingu]